MTKKRLNIRPVGLKGREVKNRMLELMENMTPIKENVDRSVVEITKKGPDGNVYAIVRENKDYYIKIAEMKDNLVKEDFEYVGGLANKKDYAYPSYAKALKHLNLKFHSLNEALGLVSEANIFQDDKLIEHHGMSYKSYGFVDNQEYVEDKKGEELEMDAEEGSEEDGFGSNVTGKKGEKKAENDWEKADVKLTESEKIIENMLTGEEIVIPEPEPDFVLEGEEVSVKKPLSITETIEAIDDTIYKVTGEGTKEAMNEAAELLKTLKKEEVIAVLETITGKKKV